MKKCPYCAEEIQDEAIKCKHCREMLTTAAHPPPTSATARQSGQPMVKVAGWLLLLTGLATVLYFLMLYDTGVEVPSVNFMGQNIGGGKVHNIGLMQNRQNGIIIGSVLGAAGMACLLIGLYAGGGSTTATSAEIQLPATKTVISILTVIGILLALGLVVQKYRNDIKKLNQETKEGNQRLYGHP